MWTQGTKSRIFWNQESCRVENKSTRLGEGGSLRRMNRAQAFFHELMSWDQETFLRGWDGNHDFTHGVFQASLQNLRTSVLNFCFSPTAPGAWYHVDGRGLRTHGWLSVTEWWTWFSTLYNGCVLLFCPAFVCSLCTLRNLPLFFMLI